MKMSCDYSKFLEVASMLIVWPGLSLREVGFDELYGALCGCSFSNSNTHTWQGPGLDTWLFEPSPHHESQVIKGGLVKPWPHKLVINSSQMGS